MKVMNCLVITLEDDKRFLCVWLLYYVSIFADSRKKVPRYRSSPTSKITWKDLALIANRQNCSHNRAAKHIKISCLPRGSSLNHSWPWWILPQVIRDIHISPRLSCPWFLAERDYCSIPLVFTCTPECPNMKKHNRLCFSPILDILHRTNFGFFSLLFLFLSSQLVFVF